MKAALVYGVGPVLEAIAAGRRRVREVLVAEGRRADPRTRQLLARAQAAAVTIRRVPRHKLDERAAGGVHQGVVALAEPLPAVALDSVAVARGDRGVALLVALDGVQDPHNLGAILRTAACAGAAGLIVPRDRAARLTPAAIKVAEGAAEHVPVVEVANLARALRQLGKAGLWSVGLDGAAPGRLHEVDLTVPTVIVLGGEGSGLRRLVRETCDSVARLDTPGAIGTLNVSAAAAVALFEAVRQRASA